MLRLLAIILAAEMGGQDWGNYVHEGGPFGIISLLPYIPGMIGLLWVGRWLEKREAKNKSTGEESRVKNQKWIILAVALILIAGTAGALTWLRTHQKLGRPGLKTEAIPGGVMMKINLPERVLDFTSTNVPEPKVVLDFLPPDTSYAERLYTAPDGFRVQNTIILMGTDRTSIHKPDYCLPGQGWGIKDRSLVSIPVTGTQNYQLPVAKWILSNAFQTPDGQKQEVGGIYVFWLVADGEETPDNYQRMWWLARDLVRTGVLQRWAYVSYFAVCAPGQEEATFERMKNLIALAVPEYQFPPAGR